MANFGLLASEIALFVWNTPANFDGFPVLAALLHSTLVVGVSQTAALNRDAIRQNGLGKAAFPKMAQAFPAFRPMFIVAKQSPISPAAEHLYKRSSKRRGIA